VTLNFSGVWKANLEKSKLFGPAPKAMRVKIEHSDPTLVEEILITKIDGSEDRVVFRCVTTGDEIINSIRSAVVRSCARWEGAELVIESWMNVGDRESYFRDHWSLSDHGQVLTMEHRNDDLAGQITMLERIEKL
jgi:hypothetical protein